MDPYSTLGVDRNASDKDIKTAFKNLAKTHHPDRGGDESKFKQINEAYSQIKNQDARQQYEQEQQRVECDWHFEAVREFCKPLFRCHRSINRTR